MTQVVTDMVSGVVPVVAPEPVSDAADRVTDMVADVVTADGGLLDRQIPRPRGVTTLPLVDPGRARADGPPGAGHLDRRPGAAAAEGLPGGPDVAGARPRPRARAGTRRRVGVPGSARAARRDRDGPGVAAAARRVGSLPAPGARAVPWRPAGRGPRRRCPHGRAHPGGLAAGVARRPGRPRRAGGRLHRRQRTAVRRRRTPSAPARRAGRPAARRPGGRGAPPGERHPRGGRGLPHPCVQDPGGGRRAGLRGSPGLLDGGPRPRRRRPGGAARREAVARPRCAGSTGPCPAWAPSSSSARACWTSSPSGPG